MNRIIKIGMDVHTTNYTLCAFEPSFTGNETIHISIQVKPEVKNIVNVIKRFKHQFREDELDIECGYEAGCLEYSLYHSLTKLGIKCVILAPTTMKVEKCKKIKNDYRDSKQIAECLAYGGYKSVYIPTAKDNAVKEYMRMRNDINNNLKSIKQQLIALLTRSGLHYDGNAYWTAKHINWIKSIKFEEEALQETLAEYFIEYEYLSNRVKRFDERIEKLSKETEYKEKTTKLKSFIGIKTHTALSLIVETSDFNRFKKGNFYATYLGLTPEKNSSGDDIARLGITKSGNRNLRRLLVECAQCFTRGQIGHKSLDLIRRQSECSSDVVAYADKANSRLRRKYYQMIKKGKKFNVAVTAIARELACFIWGMMTNNIM